MLGRKRQMIPCIILRNIRKEGLFAAPLFFEKTFRPFFEKNYRICLKYFTFLNEFLKMKGRAFANHFFGRPFAIHAEKNPAGKGMPAGIS